MGGWPSESECHERNAVLNAVIQNHISSANSASAGSSNISLSPAAHNGNIQQHHYYMGGGNCSGFANSNGGCIGYLRGMAPQGAGSGGGGGGVGIRFYGAASGVGRGGGSGGGGGGGSRDDGKAGKLDVAKIRNDGDILFNAVMEATKNIPVPPHTPASLSGGTPLKKSPTLITHIPKSSRPSTGKKTCWARYSEAEVGKLMKIYATLAGAENVRKDRLAPIDWGVVEERYNQAFPDRYRNRCGLRTRVRSELDMLKAKAKAPPARPRSSKAQEPPQPPPVPRRDRYSTIDCTIVLEPDSDDGLDDEEIPAGHKVECSLPPPPLR